MQHELVGLDEEAFVTLLGRLVGEAEHLQNNPPERVPVEDRALRHVLDVLAPLGEEAGGRLVIKRIAFVEGRSNLVVEYPGEPGGGIVSFVGCHLDVVPANPHTWRFPPFQLTRAGDELRGRGTTDCLGHAALLTELFAHLGRTRPPLRTTVVGVWIANEEDARVRGIGVDALVAHGHLDHLKAGPLYWMDVADSQPCIGTGGVAVWQLTAHGKLFHSGLPHKAINAIELAMAAVPYLQCRFHADFPPHPDEATYGFETPSTMKPTQWSCPAGSVNQIPGEATVGGDVRVTPFYAVARVVEALRGYVSDLNADPDGLLPRAGPASAYGLPAEGLRGRLEIKFGDAVAGGLACRLDSAGHRAMTAAFEATYGRCQPFAVTGSLPCVKELQEAGYDVQTFGFGLMRTYHADDEFALLGDFVKGFEVLQRIVQRVDFESRARPFESRARPFESRARPPTCVQTVGPR